MENTLLIGLSHQASLRRQMDVVANNLANMNTTGFKAQRLMSDPFEVRSEGGDSALGDTLAFVRDAGTLRDMQEGALEPTGNPLDLAVRGDGFFAVETPIGERYTRAGHFRIDAESRLVTDQGHPVLGEGGQTITIDPGESQITVAGDGTVSGAGGALGRLRIVRFEAPEDLRAESGGLMAADEDPQPVDRPEVVQGMLERANVEPIAELTRMIAVQRAYEGTQKMIEREDERIRKMMQAYLG